MISAPDALAIALVDAIAVTLALWVIRRGRMSSATGVSVGIDMI